MKSPNSHILITHGGAHIVVGLLWPLQQKAGLGRLPGDIVVKKENFSFNFPLATSIIVSLVLTLLFWFSDVNHTPGGDGHVAARDRRASSLARISRRSAGHRSGAGTASPAAPTAMPITVMAAALGPRPSDSSRAAPTPSA